MLKGYIDKEGNVVYKGVGLGKPALLKTLKSLHKKRVIIKEKRYSEERGYEATNYKLNIKIEPRYENDPLHDNKLSSSMVIKSPSSLVTNLPPPLVEKLPPQYKNIQQHVDVISKNREEEKALITLLYLNIDKKIARSLIKKHGYKKINTYIDYLNYKLDKGFKPKDSIAAFLVDSIVNSYILPENFKTKDENLSIQKAKAKKCFELNKSDCIASETLNLHPYCPYCEKISKNIN